MMKNIVKIKVMGKSTYTINILSKRGIIVRKVKFCKDYIVFSIDAENLNACIKIFEETKRKYTIISTKGLGYFFKSNIKRIGLVIGMVVALFMMIVYSSSILTVNISGNDLVESDLIQQKVDKIIKVPVFNKKFDKKKLEKDIINIDGISSASVEKRGTCINVVVFEELPHTSIEDIKSKKEAIVSKYDSVITRMVIISGTPLAVEGQAVKKGQELIAPYLIVDENTKVFSNAGGDVYGRVWVTKSKTFHNQTMTYERTGKSYTVYDIKLFNWIKKDKNIEYEHYEVEKEKVSLGGAVSIFATRYTYYETEKVFIDFDFELESEAIIKEMINDLEKELPIDAKKLRNWYVTKRVDKIVQLDIYYEIEMCIV